MVEHTTASVVGAPRRSRLPSGLHHKNTLFCFSLTLFFSSPASLLTSSRSFSSPRPIFFFFFFFFFFFLLLCSPFFEFSFCFLYSILFVCLFCFFTRRILSLLTAPETSAMASDVSYPDPNGNSKVWSESFYKMKSMSFYCGSCIGADSKSSE